MQLLTKEQQESYENVKIVYICKEKFKKEYVKDKKYCKVRGHCHYPGGYRGPADRIYNSKDSVPKKIPMSLHNGSSHDYHSIIKELAEEFEKQFNCLEETVENK